MAVINESTRGVPPFPDPKDTEQGRINMQIIELVRFILKKIEFGKIESRISDLEKKSNEFNDIING